MLNTRNITYSLKWLIASACIVLLAIVGMCFNPAYASAASEPTPADKAILKVDVTYSGVDAPSEEFVVKLTPQDGAPAPAEGLEQSCLLSSHTTAGRIEFTFNLSNMQAATYRYMVEEVQGTTENITYASDVYTIEFETYFENGAWYATAFRVVKSGSTEKPDSITFANTYSKPSKRSVIGDPPVRIEKAIVGDKPLVVSDFVFVMEPESADYPLPVPASSAVWVEDGKVYVKVHGKGVAEEIGDVEFTEVGEYAYKVYERDDRIAGYSYDDAVFRVVYTVTEDGRGGLACSRVVFKDGSVYATGDKPLTFNNTYEAPEPLSWIDGSTVRTTGTIGRVQTGALKFKPGAGAIAYARLIDPATGEETDALEVDVYDEAGNKIGTYKLNPTPIVHSDGTVSYEITFTPVAGYVGTPPPITLRVYDENGYYAEGIYQPQVTKDSDPSSDSSDSPTSPTSGTKTGSTSTAGALSSKTGDYISFIPLVSVLLISGTLLVFAVKRRRTCEGRAAQAVHRK